MIPQNFKDFLFNIENKELYQSITLLFFIFFFSLLIIVVFSKSKNDYIKVSRLPLEDE